jgi:ectoine hydroxylase-related dioxygenase (phytanoyl-CoA dioxygenase family)
MLQAAQKNNVTVKDQQGEVWKPNLKTEVEHTSSKSPSESIVTEISGEAGVCSIHDGRLWHGSGPNKTANKPRRGLGIHFIRSDATLKNAYGPTLAH